MYSLKELIETTMQLGMPACQEKHLYQLAELVDKSPKGGCLVECGVARGGSAAILLYQANKYKKKLYLCDSYEGFPKAGEEEKNNPVQFKEGDGKNYLTEDLVRLNLNKCKLDYSSVTFVKGFFEKSMPKLAKTIEPISLLHFDGDYYKSANDVLDNLMCKMMDNGIIVFHDYPWFHGIKKVVEERFKSTEIIIPNNEACYVMVKK